MELKELNGEGQTRVRSMVAATLSGVVNQSVEVLTTGNLEPERVCHLGPTSAVPVSFTQVQSVLSGRFPWVADEEVQAVLSKAPELGDFAAALRSLEVKLEVIQSNFDAVVDLSVEGEEVQSLFFQVVQGLCPLALHQFENYLRWKLANNPGSEDTRKKVQLLDGAWQAMWHSRYSDQALPDGQAKECFLRCYFAEKQSQASQNEVAIDPATQILISEFPRLYVSL